MNPYIKTSERTVLVKNQEAVNQPLGIDYDKLMKSIGKIDKPETIEKKSSLVVKDLRKTSNNESMIAKELEENDSIKQLDQSSIIPIPGLAVEYENGGSQDRPPDSDWQAPHGPQWGPMTS